VNAAKALVIITAIISGAIVHCICSYYYSKGFNNLE